MRLIGIFTFFVVFSTVICAQRNYTDHKPQYTIWEHDTDQYIIDKIAYTETSTVIYFRFVCDNVDRSGSTSFHPPGGRYAWYLKGRNVSKNVALKAVKNVRRNGVLVKKSVEKEVFYSGLVGKTGHTVYSCEVHFPRLPDGLKEADLIEGKGQESNRSHFNCFRIQLKTWEDDLGTKKDSDKTIDDFEKKYTTKKSVEKVEEKKEISKKKNKSVPKSLHTLEDITCGGRLLLDKIQFHDNSTNYKGMVEAQKVLEHLVTYLVQNPAAEVTLHGYTDVFGNKERNLELSKARVVKIQRWLTMRGIPQRRIQYEAHGSASPIYPEGDVINRRVEIAIKCP
jgi:outer membrane protein OmpA-like peptidoglycan-associated protein